jgi:N-methylhydantoinase A/oxoprolinase/acetone carboxylase beta subunit
MPAPTGFTYTARKNGEVVITHEGRQATVLRGEQARKFLDQVKTRDPQQLMARVTGNYKRGNERS